MNSQFLARQPIHDKDLVVFAYELLHRQVLGSTPETIDGDSATDTVMSKAFLDIGLENLVGPHKAFINLTESWILKDQCFALPKDTIVLEVLEDVPPTDQVIGALTRLHNQGYTIALDDFLYSDDKIPLVKLADIVKIDVLDQEKRVIKKQMDLVSRYNVKLLAEKVETYDTYETTKELGFDYFQGYFFCKPLAVENKELPANRLTILSLLSKLQDPDIDIPQLDNIIKQDVLLSQKILNYVNSAHFALPQKVDSIPIAARLVGINQIKTWTILLSLLSVPDKPFELIVTAVVRAMMCEQLAHAMKVPDPEPYFSVGLFSVLDALFDIPLHRITDHIPLSEEAIRALLYHEDMMGSTLECVISHERANWNQVNRLYLPPEIIQQSYFDALTWTSNMWSLLR
jgi:EAL and modified HD-GYP domain-containing signal transduction protein